MKDEVKDNFDFSQRNLEAAKAEVKKVDEEEKKDEADEKPVKKATDEDGSSDEDDGFFDTISNANDEKRRDREAMRGKDKRTEIY